MKAFCNSIHSFFFLFGISFTLWLTSLIVYSYQYERDALRAWYFHQDFLLLLLAIYSIILIGLARYRGLNLFRTVALVFLAIVVIPIGVVPSARASQRMRPRVEKNKYYEFDQRLVSFVLPSVIFNLIYCAVDDRLRLKPVGGEAKALSPPGEQ